MLSVAKKNIGFGSSTRWEFSYTIIHLIYKLGGTVGAVGKIFVNPTTMNAISGYKYLCVLFSPKLTQFYIRPRSVNENQCLLGANVRCYGLVSSPGGEKLYENTI